ncbi:DNA-binding MarR family transcriptional regulator [Curtobacterium sp. PhB130]|uniref:MarR family winged helix-turn-helix transcriptional regulator n=1 Tax=unclassified Curtobacterium TaxID=257496 RepID=UPI000FAEB205|nr:MULTISPECIES: MarR family transcriptional regulator [unclassified Curtobacterium]ROS75249.1 DNA-binding MarR family transcriptional regulator [Curtobacterium sp. PhB130]TCK63883.1 DNA-binding MarR family transcriptional regulator [Curtobacterium sp. PhB136]
MTDTRITAAPASTAASAIPAAPTSPVDAPVVDAPRSAGTTDGVEDSDLGRLMTAFRLMQTQHARVLNHESVARGLNPTDSRFVFFLAAADGAGVTPKQASEYLELSTGAMTSLIDRLEKRAHIERRPNPDDRRSILLHLTASGEAVAKQIGAVYSAAFREVVAPAERAAVADAFARIGDALGRRSEGDAPARRSDSGTGVRSGA